jgi:hypothetical protein
MSGIKGGWRGKKARRRSETLKFLVWHEPEG